MDTISGHNAIAGLVGYYAEALKQERSNLELARAEVGRGHDSVRALKAGTEELNRQNKILVDQRDEAIAAHGKASEAFFQERLKLDAILPMLPTVSGLVEFLEGVLKQRLPAGVVLDMIQVEERPADYSVGVLVRLGSFGLDALESLSDHELWQGLYGGGYDRKELEAFHHGMQVICKAAAEKLASIRRRDPKDEAGLPGEERGREEPVGAGPVEGGGGEAPRAGGGVQAPEEVVRLQEEVIVLRAKVSHRAILLREARGFIIDRESRGATVSGFERALSESIKRELE